MFNWFKKHFIPHQDNEHRPHILRGSNTCNIIVIVLLLEIITFLVPIFSRLNMTDGIATVLPSVLSLLTNNERQSQNLQTLKVNPILNKAAEMKAIDMATKGYFAHTSPEGKNPWYWLQKAGYVYEYAGENLAINFSDSIDVTLAWMASPTHKENIIKKNYTEIGTGVAVGMYQGRETIFVAQVYANPVQVSGYKTLPSKTETTTSNIIDKNESNNILGSETVVQIEDTKTVDIKIEDTKTENNQNISQLSIEDTKIESNQNISQLSIQEPTFWQKIISSPRNTTNMILYFIFGIITIALLLYLFIKMKNHHSDLIINGLAVLSLIVVIFTANYYLSHYNMVIMKSLDYSNADSL